MKITLKRTISFLLALVMVLAMLPAVGANAVSLAGSFDVAYSPEPGKLFVRGWGMDLDNQSSTMEIHVYIGGKAGEANVEGHPGIYTTVDRDDVNQVLGTTGVHGFEAIVDTAKVGIQHVYIYVIGSDGTNFECGPKTVYIPKKGDATYGEDGWSLSAHDKCPEKPDGVYRIVSAANPNYSLNISDYNIFSENVGRLNDGANLQLFSNKETDAQLFHLRRIYGVSNPNATIVSFMNINSQRFVDQDSNSSNVHQFGTLPENNNRRWEMQKNSDGTYSFKSLSKTNENGEYVYYMTIQGTDEGTEIKDEANIYVAEWTNSIYQKFYLNAEYVHGDTRLSSLSGYLKTGEHRLWESSDGSFMSNNVMSIAGSSTNLDAEATVTTPVDNHSLQQIFDIQQDTEGWYTIRNINSGLYLVGDRGSVQQRYTTSDAAKWAFIPRVRTDTNANGETINTLSYWIVNKATGLYMGRLWGTTFMFSCDNAQDPESGYCAWGMEAFLSAAPIGSVTNGATGIAADQFDMTDTISLPIKIFDYHDDGLLFEYSLANEHENGGFSLVAGSITTNYPSWTIGRTTFGKDSFGDKNNSDLKNYFIGNEQFWNSSPDGLNNIYMVMGNEIDLEYLSQLLNYSFYGEMITGNCSMGLVKPTLREVNGNRLMEYNDEVVAYVADLLDYTLTYREQYENGTPLDSIEQDVPIGTKVEGYEKDMAGLLVEQLKGNGENLLHYSTDNLESRREEIYKTLEETYSKQDLLIGTWDECKEYITTYTDAAYFLLNNLFYPESYNTPQNKFDYLVLSKATLTNGKTAYVFDSNFSDSYDYVEGTTKSAVKYDFAAKTISNTSMLGKPFERSIYETAGGAHYTFLPVFETDGTQKGFNNYYTGDFTDKNYSYVLQCNGKFTYTESDGLFFDFEGDDDVYLFINGQLVLDIGGAHGATAVSMNLNDYVYAARKKVAEGTATDRDKALALVDGEDYSFDFYYMERHTAGANMRIATNIRVSDPNLDTDKKAYQGGLELNNGGLVNEDEHIEYSFELSNPKDSIADLYHLSFTDAKLGMTIDSTNGLIVNSDKVVNSEGDELTAADLKIYYTNDLGVTEQVTLSGEDKNEALKTYMAQLSGKGLRPGCGIEIRGIYYNIEKSDFDDGRFTNTLFVTANQKADGSGDTYQDSVNMVVCMATGPEYYQWSGKSLNVDTEKFVTDVNALLTEGSALQLQIAPATSLGTVTNLELCDMKGNVVPYSHVTASKEGISIAYAKPGNYVFYVKVTQSDNSTVIIPVQVYVTGVPDSLFVLDYGLKVDLGDLLTAKDTLSVAGKKTSYTLEALLTEPGYANNHITFTSATAITSEKMEISGKYGVFTYENGKITYQPNKLMEGSDSIYFAVRVYEGTASDTIGTANINTEVEMYKTVTVLPATSVYYEDNFVKLTETTITESKNENDETVKVETVTNGWSSVGSASTDTQDADVPGANPNKVYGYDTHYTNMTTYSYGSAMKTTVTAGKYATASFSFWGTGFDVISLTSCDTGTIVVKVTDAEGKYVVNYLVDTYYGYKFENGKWVVDTNASNTLYQVPVIKVDLNSVVKTKDDPNTTDVEPTTYYGYGKYNVEIVASYGALFDHQKDNSYDFYLDAIRIYNPANNGKDDPVIRDAYIADGEYMPTYQEIRDQLISQDTFGSLGGDEAINGAVYIDGTTSGTIADYKNYGPNNEVYLQDGQAIVFNLMGENLASAQIGMKSNGTARVTIYGLDEEGVKTVVFENKEINTATEMYYAITPLIGKTIVIKNAGGMLSLTSLKTTAAVADTSEVDGGEMVISLSSVNMALASLEGEKDPVESEGVIAPNAVTLTYEDEILLNIYFTITGIDPAELGLMTYTADGSTLLDTIPGADYVDGQYVVTTKPIAAKNLGDTVYFRIYAKLADGSYVYSNLLNYSPKTYAMNILNNSDDVAMKALVVAMLNYSAEAQKYFDYKTDALVNADLTAEQKALVSEYSADMIAPVVKADKNKVGAFTSNGGFGEKYPTVSLEGAFAINYYFEPSYPMDSGMTLYYWTAEDYVNAEVLTAENATGILDGNTVSGIAAKDIDSTIYVAGVYESDGVSYCTGVLAYSVGTFCARMADSSALARSIAVFGSYAKAYFA